MQQVVSIVRMLPSWLSAINTSAESIADFMPGQALHRARRARHSAVTLLYPLYAGASSCARGGCPARALRALLAEAQAPLSVSLTLEDEVDISRGDVILEVNRKPVTSADQFRNDVKQAPADKDMLLLVWANGGTSYRVVHPANPSSGSTGE